MPINLYTHQLKALEELDNGKVLRGGVGTGKSRVSIAYYFTKVCKAGIPINGRGDYTEMLEPRDLYIITTAKKRDNADWSGELAEWGLGRDISVSFGHTRIVVESWNNITQFEDVKDAFFIFDEQRLVGSGPWVKAFIKIAKANQWILLSATPGDTWMDYVPVFIANGWYKNRTEFIRTHVVYNNFSKFPKIDRYVEVQKLVRYRNQILVDMPYERSTIRHVNKIFVDYDKALFEKVVKDRWHIYEDRPLKDVGEMFIVMRKLVNTHPSRVGAIMKLMEKHPKLIVFYNFNYELEFLRTLGGILNVPSAEWNGQKHEEIPETDSWIYLVQYTAGAEGWNCISTDAIAFWSLNYGFRIMEQARGRIDRLNTPFIDLWYYELRSDSPMDTAISKSLTKKENFSEAKLMKQLEINDENRSTNNDRKLGVSYPGSRGSKERPAGRGVAQKPADRATYRASSRKHSRNPSTRSRV
jgi:hypothetical protein